MVIDNNKSLFMSFPAPQSNPDARLDGAWIIREIKPGQQVRHGKIVARFQADGRDQAEVWLARKLKAVQS